MNQWLVTTTYNVDRGTLGPVKEFLHVGDKLVEGEINATEFGMIFEFNEPTLIPTDKGEVLSDYIVLEYWEGCGEDANVAGSHSQEV